MLSRPKKSSLKRAASSWIAKIALVFLSFTAALLAAEGILRIAAPQPLIFTTGHPYLISTHIPNWGDVVYNSAEPGLKTRVQFNSEGFRVREKESGVFPDSQKQYFPHIFFLGDSFVEAIQVEYDQTFSHLFDQTLKQSYPDSKTTAMGVGGWDNASQLMYYKIQGKKNPPDVLVLFIFSYNDLKGNRISWKALKPLYESGKDYPYDIPKSFLQNLKMQVGSHSHLYTLLRRASEVENTAEQPNPLKKTLIFFRERFAAYQQKTNFSHALETSQSQAYPPSENFNVLEEILMRFKKLCAETGTRFLVVNLPSRDADKNSEEMERIVLVREVLAKLQIENVDVYNEFKKAGNLESFFFSRDKHLNSFGHKLLAEILENYFKNTLITTQFNQRERR